MAHDITEQRAGIGAGIAELKPGAAHAGVLGGPGCGSYAERFERVYREAAGDAGKIRWADLRANPMLVRWLGGEGTATVRPGARVAVVGCGLGDDVAELVCRGYEVEGFDVAPTAVSWAKERFKNIADRFVCADVLDVPARMQRRFDLVVEIYTIQSLEPQLRAAAAHGIASLSRPRGLVLAVARERDASVSLEQVSGPPYPLSAAELTGLFAAEGFAPTGPIESVMDDEDPPVARLVGAFKRS